MSLSMIVYVSMVKQKVTALITDYQKPIGKLLGPAAVHSVIREVKKLLPTNFFKFTIKQMLMKTECYSPHPPGVNCFTPRSSTTPVFIFIY